MGVFLLPSSVKAQSVNLISNPSVEDSSSSASIPTGWAKGGYGVNTRTLNYPVPGFISTKGIRVELSNHTSGDAKWFFNDVPVTAGKTYTFSDRYSSNIPSIVDVRFKMVDGTYTYKDIAFLAPTDSESSFQSVSVNIVPPEGVLSMTIFHLINQNGYLITDEYSFIEISTNLPLVDPTNLVVNADFELVGSNNLPLNWKKGGWGTLSSQLTYPVTGINGSSAAQVSITAHSSGDAKWYFAPISSPIPGVYTYSNMFKSNRVSVVTVQFEDVTGRYSYKNIAELQPSDSFKSLSVDFAIPYGTKNVTVFHLIGGVGFLTIDNVSMRFKSEPKGVFTTGAVTFRFDDAWTSQYDNALSLLNAEDFKGTFYVVSERIGDEGSSVYMTRDQISEIYSQGHEIGAHSRTHRSLSLLTLDQQIAEINGSRQDLLAMNLGLVNTFSYPLGDHNPTIIDIVKDSGYLASVSTVNDFVNSASDPYRLESRTIQRGTTVDQIKSWVDDALENKKWLIISFHEINVSGNLYAITPDNFNQVVQYVVSKKIPVVTVEEGAQFVQ